MTFIAENWLVWLLVTIIKLKAKQSNHLAIADFLAIMGQIFLLKIGRPAQFPPMR